MGSYRRRRMGGGPPGNSIPASPLGNSLRSGSITRSGNPLVTLPRRDGARRDFSDGRIESSGEPGDEDRQNLRRSGGALHAAIRRGKRPRRNWPMPRTGTVQTPTSTANSARAGAPIGIWALAPPSRLRVRDPTRSRSACPWPGRRFSAPDRGTTLASRIEPQGVSRRFA